MTPEQIEEKLKVCRAATPGPFNYSTVDSIGGGSLYDSTVMIASLRWDRDDPEPIHREVPTEEADANGKFFEATRDPTTGYEAALTELQEWLTSDRYTALCSASKELADENTRLQAELQAARERIAEIEQRHARIMAASNETMLANNRRIVELELPIDMILFCPQCGHQHIDTVEVVHSAAYMSAAATKDRSRDHGGEGSAMRNLKRFPVTLAEIESALISQAEELESMPVGESAIGDMRPILFRLAARIIKRAAFAVTDLDWNNQ